MKRWLFVNLRTACRRFARTPSFFRAPSRYWSEEYILCEGEEDGIWESRGGGGTAVGNGIKKVKNNREGNNAVADLRPCGIPGRVFEKKANCIICSKEAGHCLRRCQYPGSRAQSSAKCDEL